MGGKEAMLRRRVGFLLEHAVFCAIWVGVALANPPTIDNRGPWFDSGGIVLGAVVVVGALGVGAGIVEALCVRRRSVTSAWAGAVLIALYTAGAFVTAFAAVSFLTSFNDNSPVVRGEWNGAWLYFAVLTVTPVVVAQVTATRRPIE